MKKSMIILALILTLTVVSAGACDLSITLLNQDPYPAVPGDYVKVVFQIDGLNEPECNDITFSLLEDYPLKFDPNEDGVRKFKEVEYIKDFNSNILIPYEIRVDEEALDGANPIEINVENKGDAPLSYTFNLEVEDVRADFEVYVKDYDYSTDTLTLEILNIKKSDVEALTVEIPNQENIIIKGARRQVVGDLDSNEYTTADFEAVPSDGEITIDLTYSDTINVRRTITKTITFDSSYFKDRAADQTSRSITSYIFWLAVLAVIIYWIVKKFKKKKKK